VARENLQRRSGRVVGTSREFHRGVYVNLREGKVNQLRNAMQIALGAGHKTLEMSLKELVASGIVSQDTAVATAFVPHEVDDAMVSPLMAQSPQN
jgi:Tfp pilus assembly pilus retraction ATPase PilT